MKFYFFKSIPKQHRAGYRKHIALQNLKAIQIASIVFFILNVVIRLGYFLFSNDLTHAENFPEFSITNWVYLAVTPLFAVASITLTKEFAHYHKLKAVISVFILLFSTYLISCGIISSVISTYDPRNSLILYLIALITIGVIFVFEYEDTLMLTLLTEVIFTLILLYCQANPTEFIYNQLISMIILGGFFFISRYAYSFKASHYMQLLEIREKNLEIEKASAFKNDVLGMVAHDLRNPIGAIESIALIMELDDLDDDTYDNVNMIKASCVKARSIIDDLLEVAKNDNNNELATDRLNLKDVLQIIVNEWTYRAEIKNRIVLVADNHPVYAHINTEKFHRVIDNLISNAIKFSKENDKIEVRLRQTNHNVLIEVKDYGLGIPKDMLPHVFDRFSKAGRKGVRGEQSTGLGLSIVRQIVEKHNGTIEVESMEKQGSTFRIELPLG